MKTSWTKGLNTKEAMEMEQEFKASAHLRRRLTELLKEKIETSQSYARAKERYDSPSWAHLQADAIGYERALTEIISIIS